MRPLVSKTVLEPGWVWQVEENESLESSPWSGHCLLDEQNPGLEKLAGSWGLANSLSSPHPASLRLILRVDNAVSWPGASPMGLPNDPSPGTIFLMNYSYVFSSPNPALSRT